MSKLRKITLRKDKDFDGANTGFRVLLFDESIEIGSLIPSSPSDDQLHFKLFVPELMSCSRNLPEVGIHHVYEAIEKGLEKYLNMFLKTDEEILDETEEDEYIAERDS
jgi:hypothetical protein